MVGEPGANSDDGGREQAGRVRRKKQKTLRIIVRSDFTKVEKASYRRRLLL